MSVDRPVRILMAEDDADDRMFAQHAWEESQPDGDLLFVEDGEELMDYLHQRGRYRHGPARPSLILLDLNMPRKDGREALREIRSDPRLREIPVVVLTTSKADEDVQGAYELGADSFVTKPVTFDALVEVLKTLAGFWRRPAGLRAARLAR